MSASIVSVCNRALSKLGAARIVDLDQDTRQARALSACFDQVRDLVLRSYRWSFALKRVVLSASAETPAFGFGFQYVLPSDFLQIDMVADRFPSAPRQVFVGGETNEYAIEGGMLLTDLEAPLSLRYIARIKDGAQWEANFADVLACKLAWELCEELTQSDSKRQLAMQEYKAAVSMALKANSAQRIPTMQPDGEWMGSRL